MGSPNGQVALGQQAQCTLRGLALEADFIIAAAGIVLPFVDSEAMNLHLDEMAKTVAPGAHAVLALDGAGWHGAKALRVLDNITLLPLPPYAPELNPIENVWAYL